MDDKLVLHKNITKDLLINQGFRKLNNTRYIVHKDLYKSIISLDMIIDLDEMEIEWDIMDKNTWNTYFPFYNNVNGDNNLVCLMVAEEFNKYINQLRTNKILKGIRKNGDSTKNRKNSN